MFSDHFTLSSHHPPSDRAVALFLFSIALLLWLTSCKTTRTTQQTAVKDSIAYVERIVQHDTTITLPGDTIRFHVPCDKDTVFVVTGNSSRSLVQVHDHRVAVHNECDEQSRTITGLIKEINTLREHSKDSTNVKIVPEKYIPGWYLFTNKAFWIETPLLLALLVYLIRKFLSLF